MDLDEVVKTLDIIYEMGLRLGLELNIRKSEIFWLSCDNNKHHVVLFPSDIGRPVLGLKLFEGFVSQDIRFIEELSMKRAARFVELMHLFS